MRVSGKAFMANPHALVEALRRMPQAELDARRVAMAAHAADLLYEAPESRVGSHVLRKAATCLQREAHCAELKATRAAARAMRNSSAHAAARSGSIARLQGL